MHLHPVLTSAAATELQGERTERAVAASELRRRLREQLEERGAVRRTRRRRRLLGRPRFAA